MLLKWSENQIDKPVLVTLFLYKRNKSPLIITNIKKNSDQDRILEMP